MATKNIEIQDSTGNIYYPHTDASIVRFGDSNVNATLSDMVYQTTGGSATAITLTIKGTLVTGYPITFIASANNGGAATTINGKKLYKPGTTTSPNLIAGKAYTVWYNSTSDCFFIKASAEGTALASDVRKNKTFSNDNDNGIVGGLDLSLLVPGNIRAGVTIDGVTGKSSVVDTADAVLDPQYLLTGYSGYDDGVKKNGTMPNNGAVTITPGGTNQPISLGFHNGSGYVLGDADLISANIKAGVNIFGVDGKSTVVDTVDTNATAGQILSGYSAYVNGQKINGGISISNGDSNAHYNATQLSAGAYSGDGVNYAYMGVPNNTYLNNVAWIKSAQPYLLPQYITSGASIFGVTGNANIAYNASGEANRITEKIGASTSYYSVINISGRFNFTPRVIYGYTGATRHDGSRYNLYFSYIRTSDGGWCQYYISGSSAAYNLIYNIDYANLVVGYNIDYTGTNVPSIDNTSIWYSIG